MKYYLNKKRYCLHLFETKFHEVELYCRAGDVLCICGKYKVLKALLLRRISSSVSGQSEVSYTLTPVQVETAIVPGDISAMSCTP